MFLPEDYKAPASSKNYMKLIDGENRFRILSAPILGWIDWTLDKKPVRFRFNHKPVKPIDEKKPIRHFWAFIVFNYAEEMIQILEITQATIRKAIEALSKDNDWGLPYFYDIKISRKGEGTDTDYVVTPAPKNLVSPYIMEEFKNKPCFLEALYDGADPFDIGWPNKTPGIFCIEDAQRKLPPANGQPLINAVQVEEIRKLILQDVNSDDVLKTLLARCQCKALEEMRSEVYDKAYAFMQKRLEEQRASNEVPF